MSAFVGAKQFSLVITKHRLFSEAHLCDLRGDRTTLGGGAQRSPTNVKTQTPHTRRREARLQRVQPGFTSRSGRGPKAPPRLERFQEMTLSHFRFDNFWLQLANLAHHFLLFSRRHLELFQRIGQMIDHNIELFFGNP